MLGVKFSKIIILSHVRHHDNRPLYIYIYIEREREREVVGHERFLIISPHHQKDPDLGGW